MKKLTLVLYIISIIILGILGAWIGMYIYKIKSFGSLEMPIFEGMDKRDINYELALMVSENETKISPNSTLVKKTEYKLCNHTLIESTQMDIKYVNMNKEEFEQEFLKDNKEFKIHKFTPKEVIVLKEVIGYCNEHYLLQESNGCVVIYKYDNNGNKERYKDTNISIELLPENDRNELKKGIEVIGNEKLNSRLEDYV